MHRLSYKTLFIILLFLLIPIVILLKINQRPTSVAAAWWNNSWSFRQRLDITNAGVGQTNVYITLTIGTSDPARFKANCGDIRFTDSNSKTLPYYIVSGCSTASTVIHINFAALIAGQSTAYLYYGNPSAANGFNSADFSYAAASTTPTPAAEEVGAAPAAWWKFDEGVGTSTYDSSSNHSIGYFGTGSSYPQWASEDQCVSGKCIYISPINKIQTTKTLNLPSQFTVSNWIRTSSTAGQAYSVINTANANGFRFGISGGRIAFLIGVGSTNYVETTCGNDTVNDNKWHFIVGIYKSNDKFYCYIDGKFEASVSILDFTGIQNNSPSLGGYQSAVAYSGYLDDVKIYPYARSAVQIDQDYTSGLAGMSAQTANANIGGNNSSVSLTNGLVGYWKFDEGAGTTTADSSGNGSLATFGPGSSAPGWAGGKYGIGVSLNGTTGYLSTPEPANGSLDFGTGDFTLSSWFYLPSLPGAWTAVINKGAWGSTGYGISISNGNQICGDIQGATGGTNQHACATVLTAGTWYHAVIVFSRSQYIYIYLNGALVGTSAYSSGNNTSVTNGNALTFGQYYSGSFNFPGVLDETRLYNRALSASEVSALYNFAPGPIAYWKFDEGTGTTAYDSSGNNNNAGWSGSGTHWAAGKIGKAALFNGSNDYLDAGNPASLNINYAITISAWIKQNVWNNYPAIIAKGYSTTGGYSLHIRNDNTLWFELDEASGTRHLYNPTGTAITNNVWTYVTATYDGSTQRVFINGTQVGVGQTGSFSIGTTTASIQFGKLPSFGNFNGSMDDVKIYNYARTQKQIIQDMNAGNPLSATKSMVAWYKFDEGFGTNTANWGIGGTALNGTVTGATWVPGNNNKALNFTGTSTWVDMGNPSALQLTSDLTITAWINPSIINASIKGIVSKFYNTNGNRGYRLGLANTTGALVFEMSSDGTNDAPVGSNNTVAINTWTHVTAVYHAAAGSVDFYFNGKYDSTKTGLYNSIYNNSKNFQVGAWDTSTSGNSFIGSIDDVKIYNYALSASDIAADYNQGSSFTFGQSTQTIGNTITSLDYCVVGDTSPCSPPVAEWKMDEGVGTTAYDTSGNGNNAAFGPGSSAPSWAQGKIGKALQFIDAKNQYLSSSIGSNQNFTTAFTAEAWINKSSAVSTYDWIVNKGLTAATSDFGLTFTSNDTILRVFKDSGAIFADSATLPSIDNRQWHHVTVTFDSSSSSLKFYLDGQNIAVGNSSSFNFNTLNTNATGYLIGAWNSPVQHYFNGSIDQVRIYNYARTPAQVAWDYNKGKPVGWWKFDECQGTAIGDWSMNGNNGTLSIGPSGTQVSVGTCGLGDTSAWSNGASGKFNASISLDNDDQINIPSTIPIAGNNQITVTQWYKPAAGSVDPRIIARGWCNPDGWLSHATYGFGVNNATGCTAQYLASYGAMTNGQWYFLVGVFDGTTVFAYKNGALVNQTGTSGVNLSVNNYSAVIGHNNVGQIDDVRIYNYALTPTQIGQLYNGGAVSF